MLQADYIKQ